MELPRQSVAVVTLGCGRNEADSDQVGGALAASGFVLVDDPAKADCVLVNTCTFIAPAREESIEVVLDACDLPPRTPTGGGPPEPPKVLVIGCMAERYGAELAEALPEAAGVLSFADYPRIPEVVRAVLEGRPVPDRPVGEGTGPGPAGERRGLPLLLASGADAVVAETGSAPVDAPSVPVVAPSAPPTAAFPVRTVPRGPWAYLKIAGGCDRLCTFCSIPSFRGRFVSRPLDELVAEARWLVDQGVRELVCVSENTTSWGKDLPGGRRAQVDLIDAFDAIEGLERVRLMYLQPAEIIPELLDAMAASRVVAPYYDLSLQHASGPVLARMRRTGDADRFLGLVEGIRERDPEAVFRSSFITGFPGETEADVEVLAGFLAAARLDWAGFFTFSVEEGTPSATMPEQVDADEARRRRDHLLDIQEAVAAERAETFVGRVVDVLVEGDEGTHLVGRSHREAPETDGEVRIAGDGRTRQVGDVLPCRIEAVDGVDLLARPVGTAATSAVGVAIASRGAAP
jgi:ribosomal protein S12 methylthiotransferase